MFLAALRYVFSKGLWVDGVIYLSHKSPWTLLAYSSVKLSFSIIKDNILALAVASVLGPVETVPIKSKVKFPIAETSTVCKYLPLF